MDHLNSVVEQVRMAMQRKNRLAMVCGFILGCIIPGATYVVAHNDVHVNPLFWALVAGGLLFSAMTVFDWTKIAFGSKFKAFGFCLLIEGVMTFSGVAWLSYIALAVLSVVNGVGTGCKLALNQKQYKLASKPAARQRPVPLGSQRPAPVRIKETVAS